MTDVVEYIETDEKQFVLFPDQHIQLFKLRLSCDPIILVVASPHLDVFTIEQIKSLDLVLQHLHDRSPHLVLCQQILELLVVWQNVKHAKYIDWKVDVAFMIFS